MLKHKSDLDKLKEELDKLNVHLNESNKQRELDEKNHHSAQLQFRDNIYRKLTQKSEFYKPTKKNLLKMDIFWL